LPFADAGWPLVRFLGLSIFARPCSEDFGATSRTLFSSALNAVSGQRDLELRRVYADELRGSCPRGVRGQCHVVVRREAACSRVGSSSSSISTVYVPAG
jgi:hypothetical protein